MAEHLRHRLLDALVGDGLLRLVLIGGLVGEGGNHQDQAVLHIGKGDLALVLIVFPRLLQIRVDLVDKRIAHRLVRRAAVLQPAGIVVVFNLLIAVGKGQRHIDLGAVFRLVGAVAHLALRLPELHRGQRILPHHFLHMIDNAVLVQKFRGLKFAVHLVAEHKFDAVVDNGLPLDGIQIVLHRDMDIRKDLDIGLPANLGPGCLSAVRFFLQAAHIFAALKMQGIPEPVAAHLHIHILGGILRGAQAQAVQPQGILIALCGGVVVFAARIQLAEGQLPVVALFFLVIIHRAAAPAVNHFHRIVGKACDGDLLAIAFARFVDGVG